ncbi:MAG: hypothetical protein OXI45_07555 [Acidobacteriota bacterium]|nr:hypothetical protein [Acidobacteriota bacterium]
MEHSDSTYGFPRDAWDAAKVEARAAMIEVARCEKTIPYTDLARRIGPVLGTHLEPYDPRLWGMLGQISRAEDDEGRGLLTVVVVHKTGDMKPGPGFFDLAKCRGRDTSDIVRCWIEELKKVHAVWRVTRE